MINIWGKDSKNKNKKITTNDINYQHKKIEILNLCYKNYVNHNL